MHWKWPAAIVSLATIGLGSAVYAQKQTSKPPQDPVPMYFRSNGETRGQILDWAVRKTLLTKDFELSFSNLNRHISTFPATRTQPFPIEALVVLPDPQVPQVPVGWFGCNDINRILSANRYFPDGLRVALRRAHHETGTGTHDEVGNGAHLYYIAENGLAIYHLRNTAVRTAPRVLTTFPRGNTETRALWDSLRFNLNRTSIR
jgi:hypothetical protein